jgi:hypothetical protein
MSEAQAPMSMQALEHKFRDLVNFGAPHCNSDQLLEALASFSKMANVAHLIDMTV